MNCWKCDKPTEHGAAECSACENGFLFSALDDDDDLDEIEVIEIDWDKVKTFEDLKEVIKATGWNDIVVKGSEEAKQLKRYLKSDEKGGRTSP